MNKHFLAKLGEFFHMNKGEVMQLSEDDIVSVVKQARAYAGGKQKAENSLMSMSEAFSKEGGDWRLFFEKEFAEPPASIQVLPRAGVYSHPKYGQIVMTRKTIKEFVDNHNNHVYQESVPIDAEHQSKLSGAVGYFKEMRLIDDGLGGAECEVEWTDRGRELIASDAFKYFSPEWFDNWQDPATKTKVSNVLVGGAITTRPFFKDRVLRPLVASPTSYTAGEWDEGDGEDEPRTLTMSAMQFTEEEPSEPKKANLDTGDVHVDKPKEEPEPKVVDDKEGKSKMADEPKVVDDATKSFVEAETKKLTEELDKEKGLRTAAEERLAKLEGEAQTRRFADIIAGRDGEGDGSPPFQGEHKTHQVMMSLIAKEFGEESEQFKEYISTQRNLSKQMREAGLYKEAGVATGGAGSGRGADGAKKFDEAVDTWMTAHPEKTKGEAVMAVSKEQPKLYVEYITEKNKKAKTASTNYGYGDDEEEDD